ASSETFRSELRVRRANPRVLLPDACGSCAVTLLKFPEQPVRSKHCMSELQREGLRREPNFDAKVTRVLGVGTANKLDQTCPRLLVHLGVQQNQEHVIRKCSVFVERNSVHGYHLPVRNPAQVRRLPYIVGPGVSSHVGTAAEIEPTSRASGITWSAGRN